MSYQGWKNYETWCVALHIDNTECTYRDRIRQGRTLALENRDDKPRAVRKMAEWLKAWVEGLCAPDKPTGHYQELLTGDLVGAALSEVDWDEIAESFLDDEEFVTEEENIEEPITDE